MMAVLTIYITIGYASYGGGPVMMAMPSMEACQSVGAGIARDLQQKIRPELHASITFSCQEVKP